MKEHFIAAHEELIADMMATTNCTWEQAYERTSDAAYDRMREQLADRADYYRQLRKDGML